MADYPDPSTLGSGPAPDLGGQAAQPQLAQQPVKGGLPKGTPALISFMHDLIKPPTQVKVGPDGMAAPRPVSRSEMTENFLGNFLFALGQGFSAAGHGPGSFGRGFGAAMTAPIAQQQIQSQLAAQGAETQQRQAQAQLTSAQAQPVSVDLGGGAPQQVPAGAIPNIYRGYGAAQVNQDTQLQKQGLANQGRMSVEQMKAMIQMGQVAKVEDYKDPNTGEIGKMAYNKMGKPMGVMMGALPSASYLPKSTSTVEFKEDAQGNIVALPKTSVSTPRIPGAGAGQLGGPAKFPSPSASGPSRIPQPQAASSPRVVMQGKGAVEVGKAFDQNANEWVQTTRADAAKQGLQQFSKLTAKEQDDNRQFNNRLSDVATKITRYENLLNSPITDKERGNMAGVLASDKFKLGAFRAELSIDRLNQALDRENIKGLSTPAKQRLLAYFNARESMMGYQRVLTGSNRGGEKQLQLTLDALPNPSMPEDYIKEGIRQFKENVKIAGQGLPRMPGIQRAQDILGGTGGQQSGGRRVIDLTK